MLWNEMADRPLPSLRLGVSSCLLGNEVRFDSGHKRDRFLTDQLGSFVEWVPVCPELELGLGVPRPPLRLHQGPAGARMIEIESGKDHSVTMRRYARQRIRELASLELSGFVLKRGSPSCGMERVRVHPSRRDEAQAAKSPGMPKREGRGLFAEALFSMLPNLPMEEEGRLHDPPLRENFIERVFAYRRLRNLFAARWTPGQVVAFHTAHKLQVMAHSPQAYRELGRLVADLKSLPRAEFRETYQAGFMAGLTKMASKARNTNVLQHAAGYFSKDLDADARAELTELIDSYREGLIPRVVPVTLIAHHVRARGIDDLQGQTYLEPHPKELMLRNHV